MPVIRKEIGDHQFVVERADKNAFPKVGKANTLYVDRGSGIVYRFEFPNYVWVGTGWDKLDVSDGGIPDTLFIQDTPPTEINKYIWYSPSEEENEGLAENQIQTKSIEGDDIIVKQFTSDIIENQSDDNEKIIESNISNEDIIIEQVISDIIINQSDDNEKILESNVSNDDIIIEQIISDIIVNQSDDSEKILESNTSSDDIIINYNEEIPY